MLGLFDAATNLNVTFWIRCRRISRLPPGAPMSIRLVAIWTISIRAFALGAGTYYLALLNNASFANGFSLDEVTGLDTLTHGFGCDNPLLCLVVGGSFLR